MNELLIKKSTPNFCKEDNCLKESLTKCNVYPSYCQYCFSNLLDFIFVCKKSKF